VAALASALPGVTLETELVLENIHA
jgi:hypothetical protein